MNDQEKNTSEKKDDQIILNDDVVFENEAIDPGFEQSEEPDDTDSRVPEKQNKSGSRGR